MKMRTCKSLEVSIQSLMCISILLQMKFRISRKRREFGAPIFFSDRNVSDVKDGLVECPSFEDDNYSLMKTELDKGIQVCLTEEC